MNRKRMWIEVVINFWLERFPIRKSGFLWWFVRIFCFLFVIWFFGFLAYAYDGVLNSFLPNLPSHASFFANGIVILYGTKAFRSFLRWLPEWASPVLKLEKERFKGFFEDVERWTCSFLPVFLLALFMASINRFPSIRLVFSEGLTFHSAWLIVFSFFTYLLIGTGIWIIVSLWLIVFRVSRQPLDLELSPQTSKTFRPLAVPSLYGAVCYFIVISIGPFFYPPTSFTEIAVYGILILFGVLAFLIPFYNIHLVLVRLKKEELQRIDEETSMLMKDLNEVFTGQTSQDSKNVVEITARLLALQIKEKNVERAEEWPVDINFFSALSGVVLMAFGRLIVELFTRIL